jgi:acetyl esterase/lipase
MLSCLSSLRLFLVPALAVAAWAQAPGQKNSPPPLPPHVVAHRDLAYVSGGHERQKLDLFLPKDARGPLPLIIWVHGGGWQNGSKANAFPLRFDFAAKGYAVASIGYRLSDAAVFPAQIQDVKAAVRWLRAHAAEYRLDPARFAAWGSSAGGHLVAMLGTAGDIKAFDVGANLEHSSRVQAVVDYYGPSDFARFVSTRGYETHGRPGSPESKLIGGTVAEHPALAAAASPVTHVSRDDAPFLILHGADDPVVPLNQSEALHAALQQVGVASALHVLPGAKHGGPEFATAEALGWVEKFLARHLPTKPAATK